MRFNIYTTMIALLASASLISPVYAGKRPAVETPAVEEPTDDETPAENTTPHGETSPAIAEYVKEHKSALIKGSVAAVGGLVILGILHKTGTLGKMKRGGKYYTIEALKKVGIVKKSSEHIQLNQPVIRVETEANREI